MEGDAVDAQRLGQFPLQSVRENHLNKSESPHEALLERKTEAVKAGFVRSLQQDCTVD